MSAQDHPGADAGRGLLRVHVETEHDLPVGVGDDRPPVLLQGELKLVPGVVGRSVHPSKLAQLLLQNRDWRLHDGPDDIFSARRSCQRSVIPKV